jgi:hypothetical protein
VHDRELSGGTNDSFVGPQGAAVVHHVPFHRLTKRQPLRSTPSTALCDTSRIGIVTLNVQHASSERSRMQARWLNDRKDTDLIVLTEVAAGKSAHTLV